MAIEHATSELLRILHCADDKRHMHVPLIRFNYQLVALSTFIVVIAMYATFALVERMKSTQGGTWFAWLCGGASAMGIGIWLMHYLGLKALGLSVPMLDDLAVLFSILAAIFASGITLLVVSGRSDSGRRVRENDPHRSQIRIGAA